MNIAIRISVLLVLLVTNTSLVLAEVRLAAIFADGMVLQRDQPIQVWGWAEQDATVTVTFAEHSANTTAGADGTWSVTLEPLAASAQGRELHVQGAARKR